MRRREDSSSLAHELLREHLADVLIVLGAHLLPVVPVLLHILILCR
eukprot:CAMPEP_0196740118 /NCGR_PEP_ID=MMETSP1091-20130531/29065_1 /TAXON_ID=302021 /ORGANISM="Rhodomonas sp., Strain CCMP768" /LENGTH=45 /DNA_ID= /DNA_START= /DNA_END= /DNA_ORIENTATION=